MANGDKGKGVVLFGVGSAVGAGLALLFQARPAKAATDSEKLDYIATLLENLNTAEANVLAAIKSLSLGGVPGPTEVQVAVTTPWTAKDPVTIFEQAIRNAGVFTTDDLVDYRNAKRLAFKVESTLNVGVIVQVMANFDKSWNLAVPQAMPFPVPANGNIDIGLAWDDWRCFVGVQITVAVAPASGLLRIRAVLQE